jgi:hypothetical protein
MASLTATTEILEVTTSSASEIQYCVEAADYAPSTPAFTPVASQGSIAAATTTTVLSAPAGSTYRKIIHVTLVNVGLTANTVRIKKDISTTERALMGDVTLQGGESLVLDDSGRLHVYDATGRLKTTGLSVRSSVLMNPAFASANLTSQRTITSTNTMAVYIGKAPRSLTSVQLRFRVSIAAVTITWAEVALAKGPVSLGANPSLTVVGFADVSGVVNSLGQKSVTVSLSAGQTVDEGDDLWALVGNQATTALQVRAQSIADDIQVGLQAARATRPSLNVGSAEAYTLDGPTVLAPWIAGLV